MRHGREVKGSFKETADENVWRLIEVDVESGESHWSGIMTVYVDDLLVSAEDDAAQAALASIAKIWATSDIEKVQEEGKPLKYCGFEIEVGPKGDGFLISQRMYEKEMVQKWGIEKEIDAPHFKPSGEDENPGEPVQATDIKVAQGMAGALLWLTTRTRPDLAMSVSTVQIGYKKSKTVDRDRNSGDAVCQGAPWRSPLHQECAHGPVWNTWPVESGKTPRAS